MKHLDFKSMTTDELWSLHEEISSVLASKLAAEKLRLEQRLRELAVRASGTAENKAGIRRAYPQVFPKYRNPAQPSETWSGRGKTPRWLTAQLRSGKKRDDFRIQDVKDRARRVRR
jgi:DNA-binding protein H-NS